METNLLNTDMGTSVIVWDDAQLGAGFCRDLQQAFCTDVGHHAASPRRHELAAISFDQKMIRRRQSQQHHCSVCAGLSAQRERVW
jgi:hypothetical protein